MTTIATERESGEPARLRGVDLSIAAGEPVAVVWEVMDVRLPFVFSGDALRYA